MEENGPGIAIRIMIDTQSSLKMYNFFYLSIYLSLLLSKTFILIYVYFLHILQYILFSPYPFLSYPPNAHHNPYLLCRVFQKPLVLIPPPPILNLINNIVIYPILSPPLVISPPAPI